ncbi:MAG: AbrB/MazE/SpoVT family DNA-binding domain-containing protein [Lachnospiraceae bacterium]|nr:AbrB/MazE/SpoVT family DNA-binding domain-containing protein [Lachnospiraceae bacterium]
MVDTGITRKLDELGRLTLPMEIRKDMELLERDLVSIKKEGNKIILEKVEDSDIFTGNKDNLIEFHGKAVSKDSIIQLATLAGITCEVQ